MSITFTIKLEKGYFISKYLGVITDGQLLSSYKAFHEGNKWKPGLHELADLSEADMSQVTQKGLRALSTYVEGIYRKHGQNAIRTAAFAPYDLPFGIARVYEALSVDSPENLQAFRQIQDAENWLAS